MAAPREVRLPRAMAKQEKSRKDADVNTLASPRDLPSLGVTTIASTSMNISIRYENDECLSRDLALSCLFFWDEAELMSLDGNASQIMARWHGKFCLISFSKFLVMRQAIFRLVPTWTPLKVLEFYHPDILYIARLPPIILICSIEYSIDHLCRIFIRLPW